MVPRSLTRQDLSNSEGLLGQRRHMRILGHLGGIVVGVAALGTARAGHDIVIYGGTSAGLMAAAQAQRMGKTAIVVEPGTHIGGLTTGGLGWTDIGKKAAIGGLARDFYRRIKRK